MQLEDQWICEKVLFHPGYLNVRLPPKAGLGISSSHIDCCPNRT